MRNYEFFEVFNLSYSCHYDPGFLFLFGKAMWVNDGNQVSEFGAQF